MIDVFAQPEVMTAFMDEFMHEMSLAFPKLLVQFEARYFSSELLAYI
jgi:hypothetical protein